MSQLLKGFLSHRRHGTYKSFLLALSAAIVWIFAVPEILSAQPSTTISYIIPDIGTPGMNTYVEIIGPATKNQNYGLDGISTNNPKDQLQVVCDNPDDTAYIRIGPCTVSWDGRMISTQIFVLPTVQATTTDWRSGIVIPIKVIYKNLVSNTVNFYIVKPQTLGNNGVLNTPGLLGSGGAYGIRSSRGAMIVDSLFLNGQGTYEFSTADCDLTTDGNQGYLQSILISKGPIKMATQARLSVDAHTTNGGPGGGGGGGGFDEIDPAIYNVAGGDGFTAGEGGLHAVGGVGTGGDAAGGANGGPALNGIPGGTESANKSGGEGTGGGTGLAFGESGFGGFSSTGGHGGGSGAPQDTINYVGFGGGGGGFGTAGTSTKAGAGQINGNKELVPMMGGSGGAGGNPFLSHPGTGGGAGGGLAVFSHDNVVLQQLSARGANGGSDSAGNIPGSPGNSGSGGGGSGGGIFIGAKATIQVASIDLSGGNGGKTLHPFGGDSAEADWQNGGNGGNGRYRLDGPLLQPFPSIIAQGSNYNGISTGKFDTVNRTFTLTGGGNGNAVEIYVRSLHGSWTLVKTFAGGQTWSTTITLPGTETMYFLVAMQRVLGPSQNPFTTDPLRVQSQVGANILYVRCSDPALISFRDTVNFGTVSACAAVYDTIIVNNPGCSTANVSGSIVNTSYGLSLVKGPKAALLAGENDTIIVRLQPTLTGPFSTTLHLTYQLGTVDVQLVGIGANSGPSLSVSKLSIDFGEISSCTPTLDTIIVSNIGCAPATLTQTISAPISGLSFFRQSRSPLNEQTSDTIIISAQPSPGPFSTNITITYQAGTITIPVTGTGSNNRHTFTYSPNKIDFGNISLCAEPVVTVIIHNTGCDSLNLSGTLDNTSNGLSLDHQPQQPLAPGAIDSIVVHLKPTSTGTISSTLRIHDDTGDSSITITGTISTFGGAVSIAIDSVTPTYLCDGAPVKIALNNTLCDSITLTSYSLSGATSSDFSLTTSTPAGIGVNRTISLTGSFNPNAAGDHFATLQLHFRRADGSTLDTSVVIHALGLVATMHVATAGAFAATAYQPVLIPIFTKDASIKNIQGFDVTLGLNTDLLMPMKISSKTATFSSAATVITADEPNHRVTLSMQIPSAVAINAGDTLCYIECLPYVTSTFTTGISIAAATLKERTGVTMCPETLIDSSTTASFTYLPSCGDSLISAVIAGKKLTFDRIAPNPSNGEVTVSLFNPIASGTEATLEIIDPLGVRLDSKKIHFEAGTAEWSTKLSFSQSGTYYLRLISATGTSTRQVVIDK